MGLKEKLLTYGSTPCHSSVITSGLDVCVVLFCSSLLDLPHSYTPEAKPLTVVYSQPSTVSLAHVQSVDLNLPHCVMVSHSLQMLIKIFCAHPPGCGFRASVQITGCLLGEMQHVCLPQQVVMGSGSKKLFVPPDCFISQVLQRPLQEVQ